MPLWHWAQALRPTPISLSHLARARALAAIKANYTKYEYRIPMRDGVKLFASVYVPKDVFSDNRTYPIMMQRTPYNVRPYGPDQIRENLGPSEFFARVARILQDRRGFGLLAGLGRSRAVLHRGGRARRDVASACQTRMARVDPDRLPAPVFLVRRQRRAGMVPR